MKCHVCHQEMVEKTRTVPYYFGERFVDVDEAWMQCLTCTTTTTLRGETVPPHPWAWKSLEQIEKEEEQIRARWLEKYGELAPDEEDDDDDEPTSDEDVDNDESDLNDKETDEKAIRRHT
jgi:hypothetical protein